MRTKMISQFQFVVTMEPTELLILEAYCNVFHCSVQSAALVMCIRGYTSYAELILQYSRNCQLVGNNSASAKHIHNLKVLLSNSDEAIAYRKHMQSVYEDINKHFSTVYADLLQHSFKLKPQLQGPPNGIPNTNNSAR